MDSEVLKHPEALVIGSIDTSGKELNPLTTVPDKFRQWTHIMTQEAADRPPEHMPYNHAINLKEGDTPPWGPVCALSEKELKGLRKWIKDMLATGKIHRPKGLTAASILFVTKAL
jgi:hypothetical protein